MKTKKVGAAGRFGSRYGKKIGTDFAAVERLKKARGRCPRCLKENIKRHASGVWYCSACGYKFAGKAYKPR